MGSLGDDDDDKNRPSKWDTFRDFAETQIFDSQFSQPSLSGGKLDGDNADWLHFLQSTQPFDDNVTHEDGFDTQVVNFGCETQVVNLIGYTQVENLGETQLVDNLGDETQLVDNLDSDGNNDTQLFDDCETEEVEDTDGDGDGSERTEVLNEAEELCDDCDTEEVADMALGKQGNGGHKAKSDAPSIERHSSGYICRGFTSIRIASVRASGLAARNMAFKGSKSNNQSFYTPSDSQSVKQHDIEHKGITFERDSSKSLEEVDQDHTPREYNEQMKGFSNEGMFRAGRAAVRKLFAEENTLNEITEPNDFVNNAGKENLPELVGLSYVDSQEPGESSQANALDFVDEFLKVNVIEFDQEYDIGKFTRGKKSKPVSSAKGTKSLAKSANLISTVGERDIFDWDDNREDEGGGEFFVKKKEAFFDKGGQRKRSFSQSRKNRHPYSKSGGLVEESRDKLEQLEIHDKVKRLVCSDPKLVLANRKGNDDLKNCVGTTVKEAKFRKNLIKELDGQSNLGSKDGMTGSSIDKDISEIPNVCFDTQMAAEAMEALCFGAGGTDHGSNYSDQGFKIMKKGFHKRQTKKRVHTGESQKRACSSSFGVSTRQSKLRRVATKYIEESIVLSPKRSKKVRKQCDRKPLKESKRMKSDAKEHVTSEGTENLNNPPCKVIEKSREEIAMKRRDIDEIDRCLFTASNGQMSSVKKQCMNEQVGCFTPIACRTRRSVKANQLERVKDVSSDFGEEVNDLTGFYPRRRTTRQKLSSVEQEVNGESIARLTRSKAATLTTPLDLSVKRKTQTSIGAGPILLQQSAQKGNSDDTHVNRNSERVEVSARLELESSPRERSKPCAPACTTPVNCVTPVNEASPICMGDEYLKQSCRKNLLRPGLMKEIDSLISTGPEPMSPIKDSRKRRDMADVLVLFSRHLDRDIIKQQKKILTRLGASVASSMSDATHFIADEFVRTRNMLEAIAFGKPVVTHLWLESCGQARCLIDERNYILSDAKKEKEFGFSLPVSLVRACQHPLLQGQRVWITPNTKPGKEILASLVKAVHGLAVERIGRTALKDGKIPDELLVLSCEEDYTVCVPFLEKGAAVYSSELLLNGIVTQKLDYERHRLFTDHVKRTRSTIWLKKDSNRYHPATKCK